MREQPLLGRVVVVAGNTEQLTAIAALAIHDGASVAVVSDRLDPAVAATVRFRADPQDRDGWDRLAMHIEQHLGPVDGVATDAASHDTVVDVFAADLVRRGHGQVVMVGAGDDAAAVVTRLCDKPPPTPSPPAAAAPDR